MCHRVPKPRGSGDGLPGAFLTEGIPATFIITPDGRIVAATVGGHDWDRPEVFKSLEALAAIPPTSPPPAPTSAPAGS